ncbi:MAG: LuxR C-terminal-related transcriptional regulator [Oscillospiraceae bacterium]|nr:LuxR C-terminal-related transcriptional regulator [Oscillospiraceae bacterium]
MSINHDFTGVFDDGIVFRETLVKKIKAASIKKNIFLSAPGGYGKTTAAKQWLASVRRKSEKITVGEDDNDSGVFYKRIASSLLSLAGRYKDAPRAASVTFDALLEIMGQISRRNPRCCLVIDDLHILKNEDIINRLPIFASRIPGWLSLCLVSRREPSDILKDAGKFEVFTREDFLFTPEETAILGEEKAHKLTRAQIEDLLETTGGWAMYVSAALSGGQSYKTAQTLTQYLESRVWSLWDGETKKSLLRLSVAPEITPELAERLTGEKNGANILERLAKTENAFLYPADSAGGKSYRFHDIFRDFLIKRVNIFLDGNEIYRLNNAAAEYYFERGEYFTAMKYFYENRNHEAIIKCEQAVTVYNESTENISVEATCNLIGRYILSLPRSFIEENPFLIVECSVISFLNGNPDEFLYYRDILERKMPEIAENYPDLLETAGFLFSLDWRVPMVEYAKSLLEMMGLMRETENKNKASARTNTVTQNLPFFHRSMRDYSEIYELKEEDLRLFRNTFGMMIGEDYKIMEQSLIAGIYYERGELVKAMRFALNAYFSCGEDTHPETVFSAAMISASALYAAGASKEAGDIMRETEIFTDSKARFLRPNFKALQTGTAIISGNISSAREWLDIYAYNYGSENQEPPFYQIFRHFTTLRSYIALGDYPKAVDFGKRLRKLAGDYNRPLDIIESGLLTSLALWHNSEKEEALTCLERSLSVAMPYGFKQIFINEGKETLPLLWELRKRPDINKKKSGDFILWLDKLTEEIYKKYNLSKLPEEKTHNLSVRQLDMLRYLDGGMSYREIAVETGLNYDTVKTHVRLAYKRLGVHNANEAAVKAKALGLL